MKIPLDGTWLLRWDDGERGDKLGAVLNGAARLDRAFEAAVPGSVHQTLLEHGIIADPNLGTNVLACRWVEEMWWHYRCTFELPALPAGERAWLVFERLHLAAVVHLNGVEVGRHSNAFYPCSLEVTEHLQPGTNTLVVTVESGLFHAMDRSATGLAVQPGSRFTRRPWLRTTQSDHGWDWAPRLLNVGISGHVWLETAARARWEGCVVLADVADDLQTGWLTVRVLAAGLTQDTLDTTLTVQAAGQHV